MKHLSPFHGALPFLFLLLLLVLSPSLRTSKASRLLPAPNGGITTSLEIDGLHPAGNKAMMVEDPSNLMGSEYCEDGDEECMKRRMMSEAHLDYIYTQHLKP